MSHKYILAAFGVAFLLSGCAFIDSGQIDYRVAERVNKPIESQIDSYVNITCKEQKDAEVCAPLSKARLIRKFAPFSDPFKGPGSDPTSQPGEVYSIDLLQGVLGNNISEGPTGQRRLERAEIMILANVFELGDKADLNNPRFFESSELSSGQLKNNDKFKVIYFSEDVGKNQPFNFSNIPLQPKTEWGGNPIAIQIVIIEVDKASEPAKALLETLAGLGAASNAVPLGDAAQSLLLDLGQSFLNAQAQDDILFEYRFVLNPDGGEPDYYPVFEPGKYVLRRLQSRKNTPVWRNLVLDHNTGRLYLNNGGTKHEEYRQETYLTLNITKYPPGTKTANYNFQKYDEVQQSIQEAIDERGAPLEIITANLKTIVESERSKNWFESVSARWYSAQEKLNKYSALGDITQEPSDTCKFEKPADYDRERALILFEAQNEIKAMLREYDIGIMMPRAEDSGDEDDNDINKPKPLASDEDQRALFSLIARYFVPFEESVATNFTSLESFKNTYLNSTANYEAFSGAAKRQADARQRIWDCDSLQQNFPKP